MMNILGGGMSGGAALTLGGGGRKGGGGMFGGSGPGGKKEGILAALASGSDCSEITCVTDGEGEMMTHSALHLRVLLKPKRPWCIWLPGYCCHQGCVCVGLRPC